MTDVDMRAKIKGTPSGTRIQLALRLDPDTFDALQRLSAERGLATSICARKVIETWVKQKLSAIQAAASEAEGRGDE